MGSGVLVVFVVLAARAGALDHDAAHRERTGDLDRRVFLVERLEVPAPILFHELAEGGVVGVIHHRILAALGGMPWLDNDNATLPELGRHAVIGHAQGVGFEFRATAADIVAHVRLHHRDYCGSNYHKPAPPRHAPLTFTAYQALASPPLVFLTGNTTARSPIINVGRISCQYSRSPYHQLPPLPR